MVHVLLHLVTRARVARFLFPRAPVWTARVGAALVSTGFFVAERLGEPQWKSLTRDQRTRASCVMALNVLDERLADVPAWRSTDATRKARMVAGVVEFAWMVYGV